MLEQELIWERGLFFFLNGHHTEFWDGFFRTMSDKMVWVPFYLCFLFVFAYKKHWKEIVLVLLAIALTITLCDQIASGLAKPLAQRFRPTHHPDFQDYVQIVRGDRGGLFGFFSSHASNAFGFAVFVALVFKNRWLTGTMILFASITAYSRIYLGVHFVSDVVVGALVGSGVAWLVYKAYSECRRRWVPVTQQSVYSKKEIQGLCIAYYYLILIVLFMFHVLKE
ncbi:membrane-associated phospholipid phosphatase [Candidatus Symbiothrix dinenymphae]|nr:membrane-associated phospholipid phosphatase [Candidatus Symbiothrix dinenymphae]